MIQRTFKPMQSCASSERGATLVEFALVVPFLIMLILGTFDLGWAAYAKNTLTLAAREGARTGVETTNTTAIRAAVHDTAQGLNLTDIDIDYPAAGRTLGQPITITAHYVYQPILPLIAQIVGGSGLELTSQSSMIVECKNCP